jgi:hypothetical protein
MYVNAKTIPIETIPRIGGGEDKGKPWRGQFKNDIFVTL